MIAPIKKGDPYRAPFLNIIPIIFILFQSNTPQQGSDITHEE